MTDSRHELNLAMARIKTMHFVGIGGIGMSGIAEIFNNLGFAVSGSDIRQSEVVERLIRSGITVHVGHQADNISNADVVVVSSAINVDNPEIAAALAKNIPIIRRAEMLAELMRFRYGIAIAGTHGKTTATSLMASVMTEGGFDPTYVIGGKLTSSSLNAKLGAGRFLIAEADESDASFIHLQPMIAVVTNIDQDHMDTYAHDDDKLYEVFLSFLHNLPFYGLAVVCIDDDGVKRIVSEIARPVKTYGFCEEADIRAVDIQQQAAITRFKVMRTGLPELEVELNMPGLHNVANALAVIAVATELGVKDHEIASALAHFAGIGRRFQRYGQFKVKGKNIEIVDDYAHHPRELAATIEAARQYNGARRLVLIFQPHRYSRTRDLFDEFVKVLSTVDTLVLLEVYAAGEEPISGAQASNLATALRARGQVEPVLLDSPQELADYLPSMAEDNDLLVFCGAGDIGMACPDLASRWQQI